MALMLREGPRLRAAAHETADWLHTGIYTALPGYRALLLSGSPADPEIERVVARRGGVLRRVPDLGNDLAASAIGTNTHEPVPVSRAGPNRLAQSSAAATAG